jgi:hypothetical protein
LPQQQHSTEMAEVKAQLSAILELLEAQRLLPHVKSSGKAETLSHVKPPPSSMS